MGYLKIKSENDKIFKTGVYNIKSETFSDFPIATQITRQKLFKVSENLVKLSTIECILKHFDKKTVALNFANAMCPGGAYILGGNAQEESLCRASMLYYTIRTQKQYYLKNRFHILPDYTDYMIFSEDVPVIRDENGVLLKNPVNCSFITSPAVNRTFAKFMFSKKHIESTMQNRIDKIISLAVSKNPELIILGAFGCGNFGNKRETVFEMFEKSINKYVPDGIEIIFAVL